MNVYKFSGFIYADSEDDVKALEDALYDFVQEHRAEGRAITAAKLADVLKRWRANPIVRTSIVNYFKT